MHAPPAVACLLLSYGIQCHQRAALDKNLPFAQKLSVYAPLLVQRALVLGACSQEAEGLAGKARSPDSTIGGRRHVSAVKLLRGVQALFPVVVVTPTFNVPPLQFYVTCILCDVH